MSRLMSLEMLLALLDGDQGLLSSLREEGIVASHGDRFSAQQVDRILASRTLFHEMQVNMAGIDIILRLRHELAIARHRIRELEKQLGG